jgi:hypothetical protein
MTAIMGRKTIDGETCPVRRRAEKGAAVLALIAVIGLGVSTFLLNAVTKIRPDRQTETAVATALNLAREALVGFAIVNGKLPCPARPETETGGAGAGVEDCPRLFGALPWATLGLPESDSWGRRYSYRVSAGFTTPFDAATLGDITVLNTVGGSTLADRVPAVVVSHGKNGFHAWLPSGSRIAASADGDENGNDPADTTFVSKTRTDTFDDLVVWIDPLKLVEMVKAGGNLE